MIIKDNAENENEHTIYFVKHTGNMRNAYLMYGRNTAK